MVPMPKSVKRRRDRHDLQARDGCGPGHRDDYQRADFAGLRTDAEDASTWLLEPQKTINQSRGDQEDLPTIKTVTADKGYYDIGEAEILHSEGSRRYIRSRGQPAVGQAWGRRFGGGQSGAAQCEKQDGKNLLRWWERIWNALCTFLDCGGMRRATLRGRENLAERFKPAAAF